MKLIMIIFLSFSFVAIGQDGDDQESKANVKNLKASETMEDLIAIMGSDATDKVMKMAKKCKRKVKCQEYVFTDFSGKDQNKSEVSDWASYRLYEPEETGEFNEDGSPIFKYPDLKENEDVRALGKWVWDENTTLETDKLITASYKINRKGEIKKDENKNNKHRRACYNFKATKDDVCQELIVKGCTKYIDNASSQDCVDAQDKLNALVARGYQIDEAGLDYDVISHLEETKAGDKKLVDLQSGHVPSSKYCRDHFSSEATIKKHVETQNPLEGYAFEFQNFNLLQMNGCVELLGEGFDRSIKLTRDSADGTQVQVQKSKNMLCDYYAKENNCELQFSDPEKNSNDTVKKCFSEDKKKTFKTILDAFVLPCFSMNRIAKNMGHKNGPEDEVVATLDLPQGNQSQRDRYGQPMQQGPVQPMQGPRGGFNCIKTSGITLDFISCKNAVGAFNANFVVGDVMAPVGMQTWGALEKMNIQSEAAQGAAKGAAEGSNAGHMAGLAAMKRNHELERDQAYVKMGMKGAGGFIGVGQIMGFLKPDKVANRWCNKQKQKNKLDIHPMDACMAMVLSQKDLSQSDSFNGFTVKYGLFQNQHAIQSMAQNAGKHLQEALISGIIGHFKNKQAQMVGEVKSKWEQANFNNPDNKMEYEGYCDQYPNAPACREGSGTTTSTGGGIDFKFNTNGANPNQLGYNNDDGMGEFDDGETRDLSGKEIDDLNNIMGGSAQDRGVAGIANKVGAAGTGSSARAGSGGGGGGTSGGGGGGGGGAKKGGGGSGPGKRMVPKAKYLNGAVGKYASGSGGKKKLKGSTNPFSGLMGKRSRSVASRIQGSLLPKNIRLFTAISRKYDQVNKDGRLEKVKVRDID